MCPSQSGPGQSMGFKSSAKGKETGLAHDDTRLEGYCIRCGDPVPLKRATEKASTLAFTEWSSGQPSSSRKMTKVGFEVPRRLLREVEAQRFAFSFPWG